MRNAAEHFRVLCSLDLPRNAALAAIAEGLRSVIDADWGRTAIVLPRGVHKAGFAEHPYFYTSGFPHWLEGTGERYSPPVLLPPVLEKPRNGVYLDIQAEYAATAFHSMAEKSCDAWWVLDGLAVIDGDEHFAVNLLRSRLRKPFGKSELAKLNELMPWMLHAVRSRDPDDEPSLLAPAVPMPGMIEGMAIVRPDLTVIEHTPEFLQLLLHLDGTADAWDRHFWRLSDKPVLAAGVRAVMERLRSSDGERRLPSVTVPTSFGPISITAHFLAAAGAPLHDAVDEARGGPAVIRMTLQRHPHLIAAEVLRRAGCTPAQVSVGVRLALGRSKRSIAEDIRVSTATVEDAARKLYRRMDVHNAAALGARIWSG